MAHTKIVYVESPFVLKWYRLDLADVLAFQEFVRLNWNLLPEAKKQPLLNLYNSFNHSFNPRNTKIVRDGK